jgi:hypothetical protein
MDVRVYQVYFREDQLSHLDSAFVPFANLENTNPELREYPLLKSLYSMQQPEYWGMVSWRWKEKTALEGRMFLDWIADNAGYDVYHINPFPEVAANHPNIFHHGEVVHKGMIPCVERLMRLMGLDRIDLLHSSFPVRYNSTCHFYIGNSSFWQGWMEFAAECNSVVQKDELLYDFMHVQRSRHRKEHLINYSFVMERLVNLYMIINKVSVKYYPYEKLNNTKDTKKRAEELQVIALKESDVFYKTPDRNKPLWW